LAESGSVAIVLDRLTGLMSASLYRRLLSARAFCFSSIPSWSPRINVYVPLFSYKSKPVMFYSCLITYFTFSPPFCCSLSVCNYTCLSRNLFYYFNSFDSLSIIFV